jgi:hypothetical protein
MVRRSSSRFEQEIAELDQRGNVDKSSKVSADQVREQLPGQVLHLGQVGFAK